MVGNMTKTNHQIRNPTRILPPPQFSKSIFSAFAKQERIHWIWEFGGISFPCFSWEDGQKKASFSLFGDGEWGRRVKWGSTWQIGCFSWEIFTFGA